MAYSRNRKRFHRILRKYFGKQRAHLPLLKQQVEDVLQRVPDPVLLETGSIRKLDEGTESTLTIASTLLDRGVFYSFELRPEHIAISRECCGEFDRYVIYVEGDSVANLKDYVASGKLERIDFAFLDSANDGDHIWNEFQAIEGSFVPGSIMVCDDVVHADKGRVLVPYIEASDQWQSKVYNFENGMLVARRL